MDPADGMGTQESQYKVPVTGPDSQTPYEARNLWGKLLIYGNNRLTSLLEKIVHEFPFFPRLHVLLSSHPNLNHVVITTGIGPHGHEVMNFRGSLSAPSVPPPSTPDNLIDPPLRDHDDIATPSSPTPSSTNPLPFFSTVSTPSASTISTPTSQAVHSCTPSLSSQAKLDAAISKAKSSISHVGKKRTLDQSFMLMQQ